MKKLFLIVAFIFSISIVHAEEIYYINDNDVKFSEKEYNFIEKLFYDGYQDIMTLKDYDYIFEDSNILNSEINSRSVIYYEN